ncbi:MAG: hypothetical protein ABIK31_07725 [candidate division WOR-3 bacterium]
MKNKYKFGISGEIKIANYLSDCILFKNLKVISGSGKYAHKKEDLTNELVLIQVKTTKKNIYSIKFRELVNLIENAKKIYKIPFFCIYFSSVNSIKILIPLDWFSDIKDYLTDKSLNLVTETIDAGTNDNKQKNSHINPNELHVFYTVNDITLFILHKYDFK